MNALKNQNGFSLVSLILGLVIAGMIVGISSTILFGQAKMVNFVNNRQNTLSDQNLTMRHIQNELALVETSDITHMGPIKMEYYDEAGNPTNLRLVGFDKVYKGTNMLMDNVQLMVIDYFDSAGNQLFPASYNIPDIRRIKVTIITKPKNDEGAMTYTAYISPRRLLGYNIL